MEGIFVSQADLKHSRGKFAALPLPPKPAPKSFYPAPHECAHGNTVLWLSPNEQLQVIVEDINALSADRVIWKSGLMGKTGPFLNEWTLPKPISWPDDPITKAFTCFKTNVVEKGLVPKRSLSSCESRQKEIHITKITIYLQPQDLLIMTAEAYSLDISKEGETIIKSTSPGGVLHAFTTLSQAFFRAPSPTLASINSTMTASSKTNPGKVYTPYAPLLINDTPFFEHRGVELSLSLSPYHQDITQHKAQPDAQIRKLIAAMHLLKLTRLHIQTSSPPSPSSSDAETTTTSRLASLSTNALAHGVEIYLQLDIPTHSYSPYSGPGSSEEEEQVIHAECARAHHFPDQPPPPKKVKKWGNQNRHPGPLNEYILPSPCVALLLDCPDVRQATKAALRSLLSSVPGFGARVH